MELRIWESLPLISEQIYIFKNNNEHSHALRISSYDILCYISNNAAFHVWQTFLYHVNLSNFYGIVGQEFCINLEGSVR